ncbi:hypothetical protein BJV78DRAFT_342990 [Lactifluus subvellereus]|nr:hypothetical protein BJV78DRAFT_342990 [Lactifluus subvellereus]
MGAAFFLLSFASKRVPWANIQCPMSNWPHEPGEPHQRKNFCHLRDACYPWDTQNGPHARITIFGHSPHHHDGPSYCLQNRSKPAFARQYGR